MFKDLSAQSILEPGSLWLLPCTYLSIVAQIDIFVNIFYAYFLKLANFRGFIGKGVVVILS